jgi:hypothetical protein
MILKTKSAFALAMIGLSLTISLGISSRSLRAEEPSQPVVTTTTPVGDGDSYHDAAWSPSTETARKHIYLFTADFPQNALSQYPSPPLEETSFWKLLDKEMNATSDLALTSDPTKADYRVEVRCSGVFNCSRLVVDVKSPQRNPLTSFSLTHINRFEGLGSPKLDLVSRELTQRLDERIRLLPQGGYGYSAD